jgi:hypothetical protein
MASGIYTAFKEDLMTGAVDLSTNVLNIMLLSGGHSFTATNSLVSQVSGNEIVASAGYSANGSVLSGCSVTSGSTTKFDADDWLLKGCTFTASHCVIYNVSGANALVCSFDFGGAESPSSGDFKIAWSGAGIITLS